MTSEGSGVHDKATQYALVRLPSVADERDHIPEEDQPELTVRYDSVRTSGWLTKTGLVWKVVQVTDSGSYWHIHLADGEGADQDNWYVHHHTNRPGKLVSVNGQGPETTLGPVESLTWTFGVGDDR